MLLMNQAFQNEVANIFHNAGLSLPGEFTYKGKPVSFALKRGEYLYRYFLDPKGVEHCYTPHPSTDGDYFVWDYVPKGKGARTGKASRWTMKNVIRCAHRNTAKSKAIARSKKDGGNDWTGGES